MENPSSSIDPRSGFCAATGIFHSLRPPLALPPPSPPLSLTSYMLSTFSSSPDKEILASKTALVNASKEGASISFGELFFRARSLAHHFQSSFRLSKGDVAFILSPADSNIPVLYLALLSIGVVVTPSNPASTPEEISRQFGLVKPSIAFSSSSASQKLPNRIRIVLLDSPDFLSLLTLNVGISSIACLEIYQSDVAASLFTSGTTGFTKAAVLTHGNFTAILAGDEERNAERRGNPQVSFLSVPLFHVYGLTMLLRLLHAGDTAVFLERFDFISMLKTIEKHRVTHMAVPPPLIISMLKSDAVEKVDLSSLEIVCCGGAPLGREVAERFAKRFPHIQLNEGYGITEATGEVSMTQGPEESLVYGATGRIGRNLEARIVDPINGQYLPPGQLGELWLRGPTVMKGYVDDVEATASTLSSEGWLRTGDLCYIDEDGYLFIVDRLKELIKYKAYQVPPAELERILLSHPDISDAAVVPYADEEAGEIPMAYVVRNADASLNAEEIMDFVSEKVAPYKKVRKVAFIGSIPKSPTGKILRRNLIIHARSSYVPKL